MPKLTEETLDTGVIYKITNNDNGKCYIGKAFSYKTSSVRNTKYKHGAEGRFSRHWSNANSTNEILANECPIFYKALKESSKNDWEVTILRICDKKKLKKYETKYITKFESHDPSKGYNYFVADNKPQNEEVKIIYETRKSDANRKRAEGGKMKRNNDGLPANIYKRTSNLPNGDTIIGYFVQIKINGKLFSKAFMSKNDTEKEKLKKAKKFLKTTKEENNL